MVCEEKLAVNHIDDPLYFMSLLFCKSSSHLSDTTVSQVQDNALVCSEFC